MFLLGSSQKLQRCLHSLVQCKVCSFIFLNCLPQIKLGITNDVIKQRSDMIRSLLGVASISRYVVHDYIFFYLLAGVLAWKDPQVLVRSLQIA
ncbi:hypothetical protein HanXRQr2_Chr07g0282261 [Helianthus annuus]|uniref:Uncharacterized protein n=1 Tax=Helianthus annuus TaxID=4232 RepID=A0A9K3IJE2_HELAN|nr:hypothetical protein HanXRQr2_Chr07g0282261 [Helianthus annuus]KAJ0876861.1 hypothetical protein HanPSC8_Chr11g0493301 [Helianthus annuus]